MSYKGRYRPSNPKKYKGNPSNIVYRSLWERKFMVYCDNHTKILEWGSEEIMLPYRSPIDNKIHRYYPDFYIKADDDLQLEVEADQLGNMAVGYYSIMESSLRSKSDFDEHHKKIAKIYENFSKISSTNSLAWNDKEYTYKEILNSSDKNPTLAFPYNKFSLSRSARK